MALFCGILSVLFVFIWLCLFGVHVFCGSMILNFTWFVVCFYTDFSYVLYFGTKASKGTFNEASFLIFYLNMMVG